jgi:putative DNA primase/helicase
VRGNGGYVVGPGCHTEASANGKTVSGSYVICNDKEIMVAPDWLMARLTSAREKAAHAHVPLVELDLPQAIEQAHAFLMARAPAIEGHGGDNHTYVTIQHLKDFGLSEEKVLELLEAEIIPTARGQVCWNDLCDPPWTPDALETKVRNAYRYGKERPGARASLMALYAGELGVNANDDVAPARETACRLAINSKTGKPYKDFPNTLLATRHMPAKPELDEFNQRVVFRGPLPWPEKYGRVLDDGLVRVIRLHFLSAYGLDTTKEHVSEAVMTIAGLNRFHPVREYLHGLCWDGRARIDTMLIDFCGVEDTAYARAVARKFIVGAVARVMNPGCKFDSVLTLEGHQGAGKSTFARILASDEFFTDNVSGDLGHADAAQSLQGRWIVELAELDGLRRSEATTVKAFLSRTVDRARFAYERHAADYPRQCVFIATTNEGGFLRDPTGNRRYWPVKVGHVRLDDLRATRDQLWAEAMTAYQAGESLTLPEELWPAAAAQQNERYAPDPWEETINAYLNGEPPHHPLRDRVHSSELLTRALGKLTAQQGTADSSRLKNLMTHRLGWEYRASLRVNGAVSSGYVRGQEKEMRDEQA